MHESSQPPVRRAPGARLRRATLPLLFAAGTSVVCSCAPHGSASTPPLAASRGAAVHASTCLPGNAGYVRARLRGAQDQSIDWHAGQLQCDGDPRPDGKGMRLTFAGTLQPGNHHLRLLFGIAAAPGAGVRRELPVNVTLIFEGERRLYSTRGDAQCMVDELRQEPLLGAKEPGTLRVSARGFCVGPATAVNAQVGGAAGDSDELLLSRFDFAGLVRPAASG